VQPQLGGVAALVNYNLRKDALSHCVKVAAAKVLIFDADLAPAVEEIAGQHAGVVLLSTGEGGKELSMGTWLDGEAAKQPTTCPKVELGDIKQTDPAFLVYTSGTSGLPKAALIKHQRLFVSSVAFARQFNLRHSDRIFCVLPLYHSAGQPGGGEALAFSLTKRSVVSFPV
jgi:acyl-CoA synthetase (AMP-forming)/AMP-acid ligase II